MFESKLRAAVKILTIQNKQSQTNKKVLRRLRIWYSSELKQKMDKLCENLQKTKDKRKKVTLLCME
jgi:hypothetical protein